MASGKQALWENWQCGAEAYAQAVICRPDVSLCAGALVASKPVDLLNISADAVVKLWERQ